MKKLLRGLGLFFLVLVFAVALSAYLFFQDPVDKEAEAFFFEDQQVVADEDNAYFAFLGFFAPAEVDDIHAYGLKHWNGFITQLKEELWQKNFGLMSNYENDYSVSISKEDSDAIGNLMVDYNSCMESKELGCINISLIERLLNNNSVLLNRLKQLQKYDQYHPRFHAFKLPEFISLAKLQSMQARMLIDQGKLEDAYILLYENIELSQNMQSNGVDFVSLAIFRVLHGIYWGRMMDIIQEYPDFALNKYVQLRELFGSERLVPYAEVAKSELYFINKGFCDKKQLQKLEEVNCIKNVSGKFLKPNAIISDYYQISKEFIKLTNIHPSKVERDSKKFVDKYKADVGTFTFWLEAMTKAGMNTSAISLLNTGPILFNVSLGEARRKMVLAYLELYKNKVKPEDVNDYIANHLDKFYDPLSRKHFVYDDEQGLLMMHEDGFPPEILEARKPNSLKYH